MHTARWIQRFQNYKKALSQLEKFIAQYHNLNELEKQGLIQSFEYTYELAWKTIKDFYENQGEINIQGSKDAFRIAFNRHLINNGEQWMQMMEDRNLTTHSYDETISNNIIQNIYQNYIHLFRYLKNALENIENN